MQVHEGQSCHRSSELQEKLGPSTQSTHSWMEAVCAAPRSIDKSNHLTSHCLSLSPGLRALSKGMSPPGIVAVAESINMQEGTITMARLPETV